MRHRRLVTTLCAVLVLAAACGTDGEGGGPAGTDDAADRSQGAALRIGEIASLTGSGSPYGIGQQRGTELALDLEATDDLSTEMFSVDDRSDPDGGATVMEGLLDTGVAVVLGPTLSPVAATADPVAQRAGVPVLAVTNTTLDIEAIGDVVWRVSLSERAMLPQTLSVARAERGIASAVLVVDESDEYSLGAAAAFREAADAVDLRLVDEVGFDGSELDAEGYREVLADAAGRRPDALLLAARSTPATELLVASYELRVPVSLIGGNGFNAPEVVDAAGPAADGLLVAASWNPAIDLPASRAFIRAFQERFGEQPDAFAAQAYAGVQVLLAAVAAAGDITPAAILEGLAALGEVDTVLGTLRFDNREAVYPAAVQEVRDGAFTLVGRGEVEPGD